MNSADSSSYIHRNVKAVIHRKATVCHRRVRGSRGRRLSRGASLGTGGRQRFRRRGRDGPFLLDVRLAPRGRSGHGAAPGKTGRTPLAEEFADVLVEHEDHERGDGGQADVGGHRPHGLRRGPAAQLLVNQKTMWPPSRTGIGRKLTTARLMLMTAMNEQEVVPAGAGRGKAGRDDGDGAAELLGGNPPLTRLRT